MGIVLQTIFGVIGIAVASVFIYIVITEGLDSIGEVLAVAFCMFFFGIAVWLAWPLVLLIVDWLTQSEHLARYIENRKAQQVEHIASQARAFAWFAIAGAIVHVPGALVLAHFLRKDCPRSVEPWFMLAMVLPLSAIVLAAKAQAWTGAAFPLSGFLVTVNDSISAMGIAAILIWWASIWMCGIAARLIAALPMGPVAAFVTPVATMPFLFGYYQGYGWGWLTLLVFASGLLGFIVNGVRKIENETIEEVRNKKAEVLVSRVLAGIESDDVPDYALFLRPFRGTGKLDTQSGEAVEALDLETILARVLKPRWFVGLGSQMERSILGAGRVYFRDVEWWDSVRVLAKHAACIIIVPSAHEGTLKEIRWLYEEHLLPKCVFIMPPMPNGGPLRVDLRGSSPVFFKNDTVADQAALWSTARAALRESPGIELTPYDARGALLGLDVEGRVVRIVPLDLGSAFLKVRRLKRAIMSLLPAAPASV